MDDDLRWNSTNLVGLPAGLISSVAFNIHPQLLNIAGTREAHRSLFRLLSDVSVMAQAADVFRHYMETNFGITSLFSAAKTNTSGRRRFYSSYLKVLEGWGFDSNGPQGAVLKGWVESRFGLVPTYHKAPLDRFPSPAWVSYLEEKVSSRFQNNNIHAQLDLLYEYCQWAIRRFGLPSRDWLTLWRGVNRYDEQQVVEGALRSGDCVVHLNNLVSFTTSRERADEFGDWILEAQVPAVKIIFFPGLLSGSALAGEGEVLALGGYYQVKASYA